MSLPHTPAVKLHIHNQTLISLWLIDSGSLTHRKYFPVYLYAQRERERERTGLSRSAEIRTYMRSSFKGTGQSVSTWTESVTGPQTVHLFHVYWAVTVGVEFHNMFTVAAFIRIVGSWKGPGNWLFPFFLLPGHRLQSLFPLDAIWFAFSAGGPTPEITCIKVYVV